MSKQIKIALVRNRSHLIEDLLGATTLVVMLFVGLSLPGLI